tara:strand:- start:49 stop:291 length:243 start_codon:yes stop_codon:yes gene_type:complete
MIIDNSSMKTFKFNKHDKTIKLGKTKYKPYFVGKLPPTFGQKEFVDYDENNDRVIKLGKYQWFNYKGLTYLKENPLWEIL